MKIFKKVMPDQGRAHIFLGAVAQVGQIGHAFLIFY